MSPVLPIQRPLVFTIPPAFYADHVERDLPGGVVLKRTARLVTVAMSHAEAFDLLDDARHYAGDEGLVADYPGLASSARATVRRLLAAGCPTTAPAVTWEAEQAAAEQAAAAPAPLAFVHTPIHAGRSRRTQRVFDALAVGELQNAASAAIALHKLVQDLLQTTEPSVAGTWHLVDRAALLGAAVADLNVAVARAYPDAPDRLQVQVAFHGQTPGLRLVWGSGPDADSVRVDARTFGQLVFACVYYMRGGEGQLHSQPRLRYGHVGANYTDAERAAVGMLERLPLARKLELARERTGQASTVTA